MMLMMIFFQLFRYLSRHDCLRKKMDRVWVYQQHLNDMYGYSAYIALRPQVIGCRHSRCVIVLRDKYLHLKI